MSRAFDYCLKFTLAPDIEGGEVNDKRDPGGHTNLGVTQATLNQARLILPFLKLPPSVSDLTRDQASAIYWHFYWVTIRGDELPLPLAVMLFDSAVNQGPTAAIRFLQKALGVTVDGIPGPKTIGAVQNGGRALLVELAARRMHHYMTLDLLDDTFGLGWSRRLCRCLAAALAAPSEL